MLRKVLMVLIPIFGLLTHAYAQGDLLITPTRVVFDGNKQKEELNLVNVGSDTAIYSISFVQYNMKEDGGFTQIEKPDSGQFFADPYLRIFPRRVTLAPREPQVVSLQFRRKTDMVPGEYRSHLYFRAEKDNKPLGMENTVTDTTQLKVQLIPIFGLSIPIIIRSGAVTVSASLSDVKVITRQDSIPFLQFTINRTGNISVYGDFLIEHIPAQGKPYEVGKGKRVGVYTNINKRFVSIKLNQVDGLPLSGGKLKIQYVSSEENKKPVIYTDTELELK